MFYEALINPQAQIKLSRVVTEITPMTGNVEGRPHEGDKYSKGRGW
jgi:hypothetical protein